MLVTVPPNDKLLDLYHYEGNGDILLLATALAEANRQNGMLMPDTWVLATHDQGLTGKVTEFKVLVCNTAVLVAMVEKSAAA